MNDLFRFRKNDIVETSAFFRVGTEQVNDLFRCPPWETSGLEWNLPDSISSLRRLSHDRPTYCNAITVVDLSAERA